MNKTTWQFILIIAIIVLAALSRLVFHIPNFSPLAAIALFAAANFGKKWMAVGIPFAATWLSDLTLNNTLYAHFHSSFIWFYPGFYWQYACYILIALLGGLLFKRGVTAGSVIIGSFGASTLFFLISNFGVWVSTAMYAKSLSGLISCYVLAIPFYRGTLLGDLIYSAVLFGGYFIFQSYWAKRYSQAVA